MEEILYFAIYSEEEVSISVKFLFGSSFQESKPKKIEPESKNSLLLLRKRIANMEKITKISDESLKSQISKLFINDLVTNYILKEKF